MPRLKSVILGPQPEVTTAVKDFDPRAIALLSKRRKRQPAALKARRRRVAFGTDFPN